VIQTQDDNNAWIGVPWDENIARFIAESEQTCTPYLAGQPEPHPLLVRRVCPDGPPPANLVAWPEAPSPFRERDTRFVAAMHKLATETGATVVAGNLSADPGTTPRGEATLDEYNSASIISPQGNFIGRYDKIHLVPFGEYVPYSELLGFAHHLTQNVSDFSRGKARKTFPVDGHRFGVFICYESIFADEIRHFAKNGAEVFVNISDDGWYGDTSAPWQHLNMARMRAIENQRWILRDTNTGITAVIDPKGRVTQSVPRHIFSSLAAQYGYRSDVTVYTRYGDIFALLCSLASLALLAKGFLNKPLVS
jgi:apolipoprotein N-acyltransferase